MVYLIFGFAIFIIIFLAVRLAIKPLIIKQETSSENQQDFDLNKLQDMGLINEKERIEIIEFYWNEDSRETQKSEYNKYAKILMELKDKGFFNEEDYSAKMDKLNNYFKEDD